jgi:hypothetical protein
VLRFVVALVLVLRLVLALVLVNVTVFRLVVVLVLRLELPPVLVPELMLEKSIVLRIELMLIVAEAEDEVGRSSAALADGDSEDDACGSGDESIVDDVD